LISPVVSFLQLFPPKPYTRLSPPPSVTHAPPHLILLNFIARTILGEEYRSRRSSLWSFSPLPCYLGPLRPKYSPQHPILKHTQPTFLPQCQQSSFTPVQNNRKKCTILYILIFKFLDSRLKDKTFCAEW
jgi:hypothetical protein